MAELSTSTLSPHSNRASNTLLTSSDYKGTLIRLKEEFDSKFEVVQSSEPSEKLKEYKFLAILGQGAFGLVVIYHSSFSLSFPPRTSSFYFQFRNL